MKESTSIPQLILKLMKRDLDFREKLIGEGKLGEGYNSEMEIIHLENTRALNQIIDQIGYPTISKVGKKASEAAWLIIQHSISSPHFMKKCLILLEIAVKKKDAKPINLAYLSDRIKVFEGKKQLYGTQFDWDESGNMSPQKHDEVSKVNQRRQSLGLNTLQEQTEIMRKRCLNENEMPPKDYSKRKKDYDEWRKSVGWIK